MSCENDSVQALRRADLKVTPQRLLVVSALRHAEKHLSAFDILEDVRSSYPYVDISTVYRTVSALRDSRLITETNLGGPELLYEWVSERPHHHLVCTSCHVVISLDHEPIARLGAEIERSVGFVPILDHFAIFGLCAACSASGSTTPAASNGNG